MAVQSAGVQASTLLSYYESLHLLTRNGQVPNSTLLETSSSTAA